MAPGARRTKTITEGNGSAKAWWPGRTRGGCWVGVVSARVGVKRARL